MRLLLIIANISIFLILCQTAFAENVEIKNFIQEVRTLQKEGRNMESIRQTESLSTLEICGKKMRKLQHKAEELLARIESSKISLGDKFQVQSAASRLKLCVSCSKKLAPENCDMIDYDLSN